MAALTTIAAIAAGIGGAALARPHTSTSIPAPPPITPPPDPSIALKAQSAAALQTAQVNARRNQSTAGGAGVNPSTLLTGPSGLTTPAPVQRKTLLGL